MNMAMDIVVVTITALLNFNGWVGDGTMKQNRYTRLANMGATHNGLCLLIFTNY